MSKKFVLMPVDATRKMIDAAQRVEEDGYDAMHKAMIAAAPPPPALGGELLPDPKSILLAHGVDPLSVGGSRIYNAFCAAFMPHVARLQAELASANADKSAYAQNAIDLRQKLDESRAEVERLTESEFGQEQVIEDLNNQVQGAQARTAALEALCGQVKKAHEFLLVCRADKESATETGAMRDACEWLRTAAESLGAALAEDGSQKS